MSQGNITHAQLSLLKSIGVKLSDYYELKEEEERLSFCDLLACRLHVASLKNGEVYKGKSPHFLEVPLHIRKGFEPFRSKRKEKKRKEKKRKGKKRKKSKEKKRKKKSTLPGNGMKKRVPGNSNHVQWEPIKFFPPPFFGIFFFSLYKGTFPFFTIFSFSVFFFQAPLSSNSRSLLTKNLLTKQWLILLSRTLERSRIFLY